MPSRSPGLFALLCAHCVFFNYMEWDFVQFHTCTNTQQLLLISDNNSLNFKWACLCVWASMHACLCLRSTNFSLVSQTSHGHRFRPYCPRGGFVFTASFTQKLTNINISAKYTVSVNTFIHPNTQPCQRGNLFIAAMAEGTKLLLKRVLLHFKVLYFHWLYTVVHIWELRHEKADDFRDFMCDVFWRLSPLDGLDYAFVKQQQEVGETDCALVYGYGGSHVLMKT